jgi:hypothetical protein
VSEADAALFYRYRYTLTNIISDTLFGESYASHYRFALYAGITMALEYPQMQRLLHSMACDQHQWLALSSIEWEGSPSWRLIASMTAQKKRYQVSHHFIGK